ncbi:prostaglandin E2 receptor EP4 subtype isoform X1 [Papio anubis]|uniref:Prostaglandin E2 receptor EP4 subtype n=8 Tax=Cercopithecinae TaxID=9528 RepID=Q95J39_MACFA|nr:prostaglandin E2 receptor EP4 subtype [Macaca mulatta]XP_003899657.1 prostaglandin E2 receptor EP4 subtype isoform X1 [Papio anubis]XP_005556840.1 prostaglandin E2 receptor EP4 subtype isoform X1 [Macaca fascicularis]XP_011910656.1 PREDICTED: prostaglandin E2 receptor EP4 subtype [Cercocebus atys]XP_025245163.1 prostaglandin E2 receptor EP4 subtype [Theropithecus gelada]AAL15040.1 prostaglandin E2 subtype EP4 receptor [Papio ursinus]AAL15041.1 prostaglandin E2 subtype EP4 receptor [Macaca 
MSTPGVNASTSLSPDRLNSPVTIPAVMFIFGVVGNLVAIVVLCKSRKEQKETTFYTLVCGLAVTDLLGTLLVSPVTIATYMKGQWPGGQPLCEYSTFILLFFSLSGLSIICAMSVERYLAINHAYFYSHYVDKRLAGLTLFAVYASNVLFCALPNMGLGSSRLQYPDTWCFIDWTTNVTAHAAYSYMYAGFSSFLILATVLCNVLVCGALLRMHRQFMRRTSLGTEQHHAAATAVTSVVSRGHPAASPGLPRLSDFRRRRSFRRIAGAEIQMVILLIATSLVVLICSIPLVVRVFVNQLYQPSLEREVSKNPDLQAIRIASVNPILDPWIYILLRKTVLSKAIEKIKCLFCRIGGSRRERSGQHCSDSRRTSSAMSGHSRSFFSRELKEISSTSQTLLPDLSLPDLSENGLGGRNLLPGVPGMGLAQKDTTSLRTLRISETSDSSQGQDSESVLLVDEVGGSGRAGPAPKGSSLQVTFPSETLNLSEKCI